MTRLALLAERWFPFIAVGVFLLLGLTEIGGIVDAVYRNGDAAAAPVIAEQLGQRGSGKVILGDYRWLEALGLLRAIVWIPGHRQLGQALPFLLYALSVAGVAWSVGAAVGRRRAWLVAAILACPVPIVVLTLATLNFHGLLLVHTTLLGVALVLAVRHGSAWSTRRVVLGAAALALLTAPGLASDELLLPGGLLPFVLAATVLAATGQLAARLARAAWAVAVAAVLGAVALLALATGAGILNSGRPFRTSSVPGMFSHAQLFLDCIGTITHGATNQVLDGRTALQWAATTMGIGLLALAAFALRRAAPRLATLPPLVSALAAFWGMVAIGTFLAFIATDAVSDLTSTRYMLAAWPAVLVVIAVLLSGAWGARALAFVAVIVAGLGVATLLRGEYDDNPSQFPSGSDVAQLERYVVAQGLDHGYGGYWDAATLTYQTHFKARVHPVYPCFAGDCPFYLHRIESWYVPKPGVRTFYVIDAKAPAKQPIPPPPEWGAVAQVTFGQLTVYVFPDDVAAHFGPAPKRGAQ